VTVFFEQYLFNCMVHLVITYTSVLVYKRANQDKFIECIAGDSLARDLAIVTTGYMG